VEVESKEQSPHGTDIFIHTGKYGIYGYTFREDVGVCFYQNHTNTHIYSFNRRDPASLCRTIGGQAIDKDHPMGRLEAVILIKELRDNYSEIDSESREKAVK